MERGTLVEVLEEKYEGEGAERRLAAENWARGMVRRVQADNTVVVAISHQGHTWHGKEMIVDAEHLRFPAGEKREGKEK
jgi:hypothetical protein